MRSHILPQSPQTGDTLELDVFGVKATFRYCPPGTFLMGSPEGEEGRRDDESQREVTLTRGFWLLETPATQTLWEAATGENPSKFAGDGARPVETVSWFDCAKFVRKLNDDGIAPDGLTFDFPTNAEWEYACRAGTTTAFNVGDKLTKEDANFRENVGETTPVKSYAPNSWGFYDMHGNVFEWCKDRVRADFSDSAIDPQGASSGLYRVLRGGGWRDFADFCRSASALGINPSGRPYVLPGFRPALRSV